MYCPCCDSPLSSWRVLSHPSICITCWRSKLLRAGLHCPAPGSNCQRQERGSICLFLLPKWGHGSCLPLRPPLIEGFSKGGGALILNYPQNKSNRERHAFVWSLQSLFQSHLKTHSPKNHTSAEKELRHLLQVFMVLSASCLPGGLCGTSDHFFNSLPLLHLYVLLVAKQREELQHPPFSRKKNPSWRAFLAQLIRTICRAGV